MEAKEKSQTKSSTKAEPENQAANKALEEKASTPDPASKQAGGHTMDELLTAARKAKTDALTYLNETGGASHSEARSHASSRAHHHAQERAYDHIYGRTHLTEKIAAALLQHPQINVMLGDMPLSPGKYDGKERAAHFADRCWEFAIVFADHLELKRTALLEHLRAKYLKEEMAKIPAEDLNEEMDEIPAEYLKEEAAEIPAAS